MMTVVFEVDGRREAQRAMKYMPVVYRLKMGNR